MPIQEDRCCHKFWQYFSRSFWITLVQGTCACVLLIGDLAVHIFRDSLSQKEVGTAFVIGSIFIGGAVVLNLWRSRANFSDPRIANADAIHVVPSLAQSTIEWASDNKRTFEDFNYFGDVEDTVVELMAWDFWYSILLIVSLGMGFVYSQSFLDIPLIDVLNGFSFIFKFCFPFLFVVLYSTAIRNIMLNQTLEDSPEPETRMLAEAEGDQYSCSKSTAWVSSLALGVFFVLRSAYFVLFEYWGLLDDDLTYDLHQSMYYGLAVAVLVPCHFSLIWHTLRRRTEWYDCIGKAGLRTSRDVEETTNGGETPTRSDEPGESSGFFPRGIDFVFSLTHFLSASLIARAVFGAIVFAGEQGPEHRVYPVIFEIFSALILVITFRNLLYSDHILLDLMSGSPALQMRKKETRATIQSALIPIVGLANAFTTTIPIY